MGEKSIFIRILRFGEEVGLQGIGAPEFEYWALNQPEVENRDCPVFFRLLNLRNECFYRNDEPRKGPIYVLKNEYYFRLVEFEELEESRKASIDANRHSKIAVVFSIIAIVVSLIVGAIQLNSTVMIDYDQVSRMETRKLPITQKIESGQLALVIEALKQSNINTAELARLLEKQNKKEVKGSE